MRYTDEYIRKLATCIVNSWDMDTLINYAIEQLFQFYERDQEKFQKDWEDYKDVSTE